MSLFTNFSQFLSKRSQTFANLLQAAEQDENKAEHDETKKKNENKASIEEDNNSDISTDDESEVKSSQIHPPKPSSVCPCFVCGDEINLYENLPITNTSNNNNNNNTDYREYYICPSDSKHEHVSCAICFGQFVQHCSDYYVNDKLPLRCSVVECAKLVNDLEIRRLMKFEVNKHLAPAYERACILSGILDHSKESTPITCAKCNNCTALFPKNFKERAARLKLLIYKEREEQKEIERSTVFKEIVERAEEKKITDAAIAATTATPSTNTNINGNNNNNNNNNTTNTTTTDNLNNPNLNINSLSLSLPPLSRQQSEGILTSLFFECQNPDCSGATCLRCEKLVEKSEQDKHFCNESKMEELFNELIGILAEGSTGKCPECGNRGRKDTACSHMTCEECNTRWCYVCGKKEENVQDNDFYSHNYWTLNCDDDEFCPMYLQYKWANNVILSDRFSYGTDQEAEIALERHHIQIQRKLVDQWKESKSSINQDLALIEEMIETKFPYGIWPKEELKQMQEVEQIREVYRRITDPTVRTRLVREIRDVTFRETEKLRLQREAEELRVRLIQEENERRRLQEIREREQKELEEREAAEKASRELIAKRIAAEEAQRQASQAKQRAKAMSKLSNTGNSGVTSLNSTSTIPLTAKDRRKLRRRALREAEELKIQQAGMTKRNNNNNNSSDEKKAP